MAKKVSRKLTTAAFFLMASLGLPHEEFAGSFRFQQGAPFAGQGQALQTVPPQFRHQPLRLRPVLGISPSTSNTVVIVSQSITTPIQHRPSPKKKFYMPPRWVETTDGVLVLEPGHWRDIKTDQE